MELRIFLDQFSIQSYFITFWEKLWLEIPYFTIRLDVPSTWYPAPSWLILRLDYLPHAKQDCSYIRTKLWKFRLPLGPIEVFFGWVFFSFFPSFIPPTHNIKYYGCIFASRFLMIELNGLNSVWNALILFLCNIWQFNYPKVAKLVIFKRL